MAGMAPWAKVPRSMVRRTASVMAASIAAIAIGAWSSQFGSLPSYQRLPISGFIRRLGWVSREDWIRRSVVL